MTMHDFSFSEHAAEFDAHIEQSIPGVRLLHSAAVGYSRRFVQEATTVVDVGCSTGALLSCIRSINQAARPRVQYVGIDAEPSFEAQWRERTAANISFRMSDAQTFTGFRRMSFATSLFTLQFIPEDDRLPLLRRLYKGLISGGALIVAEKVHAPSAALQDALTFQYYDAKLQHFSERQILDKERSLRGQMRLWTDQQINSALFHAGFAADDVVDIWRSHLFLAKLAVKRWANF